MKVLKGRALEDEGVLRSSMLEDEGFSRAECWRMKVLRGRALEDERVLRSSMLECWSAQGSQGLGAGGFDFSSHMCHNDSQERSLEACVSWLRKQQIYICMFKLNHTIYNQPVSLQIMNDL